MMERAVGTYELRMAHLAKAGRRGGGRGGRRSENGGNVAKFHPNGDLWLQGVEDEGVSAGQNGDWGCEDFVGY